MSDVSFEIGGRSYPFVSPQDMTMGEARELKRLTGGMGMASVEHALGDVDPDAWTAVLLVSMRRVDPNVKDSALDDLTPVALISALADAIQSREDDAVPPPSASDAAAPSSPATTPVVSGT